jgi:DNA-directed RNA polymerase beta' subunit
MATDIKEIASINFGIYSAEEIMNMSVCKIDNPKKLGYGSVYDPRMGTTDSHQNCETCNESALVCTGHFGYIELAEPIIHPLYYKRVISFLNCFCFKCFRLILTKEQIYLLKLNRAKGENRFLKIQEKITKVDICCHDDCKSYQPKFKMSIAESAIYMTYNYKSKNKTSIMVSTDEVKRVFDNISNDDVKLLGFDPKLTHPKNFIITCLPIIPPCDRPFVKAEGNTCDDDITIQYIEIIKANNHLIELIEESKEAQRDVIETKKQKLISTIRFRILTTFNNSAGKAKHTTNGRPIKGIKERLTGKDGQLRNNLLGKRCNQTGRTVIGPDPTLKMGQLAVPELMANILTVPERVTAFNKVKLQNLVNSGEVNSLIKHDGKTCINLKRFRKGTRLTPDDIIVRGDTRIVVVSGKEQILPGDQLIRNGEYIENVIHSNREYPIDIGWIVERRLSDGDVVLLNRQPTLHRASMMAMEVVVRPHKTLRFNLAINKPFNADFDGDRHM